MSERQLEMPTFESKPDDKNVAWLMGFLRGRDWTTSSQILESIGRQPNEQHKRWVRSLATASKGEIGSGQLGYKLVGEMTSAEYQHFRNWMKSQADEMTRRILGCDKVFYMRHPVRSGNGILEASEPYTSVF